MIDSADTTIVTSDLENIEKLMSGLRIVKLQSLLITTSTLFTCNHQISEIIPAVLSSLSCSVMSVWEQGRGLFNSITQQQIDFLIG